MCVSDAVSGFLAVAAPAASTTVIPNIVDEPVSPPAPRGLPDPTRLRLLSTQRMVAVKNVELAVRCLAHLPADTTLVCAGDGPRRPQVAALAAASGTAGRVELPGHVDDVGVLLDRTDVLVHTASSETFGLSLVEAAQHGVPVVCLAGGALGEMVPAYVPGVVVREATPRAFASGVLDAARSWSAPELFEQAAARRACFGGEAVAEAWREALGLAAAGAVRP